MLRFDAVRIRAHPFFEGLDWEALLNRQIPAPFIPSVKGETDIRNFDKAFTKETPKISPDMPAGLNDFEDFTFSSRSLLDLPEKL